MRATRMMLRSSVPPSSLALQLGAKPRDALNQSNGQALLADRDGLAGANQSIPTPPVLSCGRFQLCLDRPLLMGIVNATPDSFSAQSTADAFSHKATIAHAFDLLAQGADVLDIGGESTRPGAQPVDAAEEWRRIAPVLAALRDCGAPISVDTFKPEIMHRALDAGADMINDIHGLRQAGALDAVAATDCGLCIMHMQGEPRTMQQQPQYDDVTQNVAQFLHARVDALRAAGIAENRIVLDPGFGFGKTVRHNYQLLNQLDCLTRLGLPVLAGVSRKSMIGAVIDRPADQRLAGSLAAALAAVARGARILRVHDVAATRDALAVWRAVDQPEHVKTL